jgi:hypothetical protein
VGVPERLAKLRTTATIQFHFTLSV